jgi:hypothetical protein
MDEERKEDNTETPKSERHYIQRNSRRIIRIA